jgi:hypothetical protein
MRLLKCLASGLAAAIIGGSLLMITELIVMAARYRGTSVAIAFDPAALARRPAAWVAGLALFGADFLLGLWKTRA